jgi:hypothetical protein
VFKGELGILLVPSSRSGCQIRGGVKEDSQERKTLKGTSYVSFLIQKSNRRISEVRC